MRVLHFAESFSQPTETFIKRFVQKSCLFADVCIVAFNLQNIDEEIKDNVSFFEITTKLYTRKTIPGITRFITEGLSGDRLWYKQLNHAIATFKPDIIHCHFGNTGILMTEFNQKCKNNIPYVTSFYGYDVSSQPNTDPKYRTDLLKLWKQGSGFFAEGPMLINKLIGLGCPQSKCMVNPLLIPVEEYPVKENYRGLDDPIKFLFIGRFIEKKGLQIFLKAIGQLKGAINEFSIDIIGTGPYQQKYEEIITEYDLQSLIRWHGMLTHSQVIDMMKNYDFLIHTSVTAKDNDSEGGAPTIIIEAQAIGLPVITTGHADIPFIMGYHDFLAKENDVDTLMRAIEKIIRCDNISYYAKQGIKKVHHLHNLKLNTTYEANLKKLISQN